MRLWMDFVLDDDFIVDDICFLMRFSVVGAILRVILWRFVGRDLIDLVDVDDGCLDRLCLVFSSVVISLIGPDPPQMRGMKDVI